MRPSNDLVQTMYSASSSLRAWTLKFPSVVSRSFFSSLNVSDGFTARALTIRRRMGSEIRRSNRARALPATIRTSPGFCEAEFFCAVFCLATVPPGNDDSEHNVQTAKSRREKRGAPGERAEQRHRAQRH